MYLEYTCTKSTTYVVHALVSPIASEVQLSTRTPSDDYIPRYTAVALSHVHLFEVNTPRRTKFRRSMPCVLVPDLFFLENLVVSAPTVECSADTMRKNRPNTHIASCIDPGFNRKNKRNPYVHALRSVLRPKGTPDAAQEAIDKMEMGPP